MVDVAGTSRASYTYDDYGKTEVKGDQDFYNEICYTGGIYDKSTELYYLNARYYDPEEAVFLSQDTYRGEKSDPESLNLYAYCNGNPVSYTDPSGHFPWIVAGIWAYRAYRAYKVVKTAKRVYKTAKVVRKTYKAAKTIKRYTRTAKTVKKVTRTYSKPKVSKKFRKTVNRTYKPSRLKAASKKSAKKKVSATKKNAHGNSKNSKKEQHGYVIYDKYTKQVQKIGISGGKLNKNGTSRRANSQVNKLNKSENTDRYAAKVIRTGIKDRKTALRWERFNAKRLIRKGHDLPKHKRPR